MNVENNMIDKADFLKDLLFVLRETFEGSPEGQPSAYLDRGVGVFRTLETVDAETASKEINGSTIAAHTEHLKFYLDRIVEFVEGSREPVNWEQSWLIETVDETEWGVLQHGMMKSYENVLRCLAEVEQWGIQSIGGAVSIVAHTAYHLGAIRQMIKEI